ncbi:MULTISPECIES: hypothetical protein [unclassified Streptomyces]|uniref:hypothetical protein n=1 Tax=unclassified Streptomyces TaxID=2593676 RepID=UPI003821C31D
MAAVGADGVGWAFTSNAVTVTGSVLVGGREPGPVYFDVGSGPNVPSTTHWSAYDGRARRPRAETLRAVCACGWRSAAQYPLDWDTIGNQPLYEADIDLTGPLATGPRTCPSSATRPCRCPSHWPHS